MSVKGVAANLPAIRRANKAEIAEFYAVSLPTVDAWIRKGMPAIQKGSKGIPWVFDLLEVVRWKELGGTPATGDEVDPEKLPPADRLAWYRSEKERRAILKDDRETLAASEVAETVATAYAAQAQDLRAIPDRMERRHGVSGQVAQAIAEEIDAAMDALATRLQTLMDVTATDESDDESGEE